MKFARRPRFWAIWVNQGVNRGVNQGSITLAHFCVNRGVIQGVIQGVNVTRNWGDRGVIVG